MSTSPTITTGLGKAELDRVLVRGRDLNDELVGNITFAQMTWLMLVGRLPEPAEARMIDALLVILVEHGMVSNVVAARTTYHSAPEALQGAVAAALLSAGSRHLGSSELAAKMLQGALAYAPAEADLDALAIAIVEQHAQRNTRIPGIGHGTHPQGDPRAERLFAIARETGVYGRHCELLQRVAQVAERRAGRRLPVNVTGAIAAAASDMGLRWELTKSFALIGRTLGALAHIGEEMRNPQSMHIHDLVQSAIVYEVD